MKIGILQTGYPPSQTIPAHGTYADAFIRLLDGHGFEFSSWAALEGELPSSTHDADGWLITGSKFGAYDDLPWIAPLEDFLREAYANDIPIVGICFGHQILAQALGGKVAKYAGGWSVGRVKYQLDGLAEDLPLYAWHQDQVISLPPDATVAGSTDFCRYAALSYGNKAYTVQPHPEFTKDYIVDLLDARKSTLPAEAAEQARQSIESGVTRSTVMADKIADFFKTAGPLNDPAAK